MSYGNRTLPGLRESGDEASVKLPWKDRIHTDLKELNMQTDWFETADIRKAWYDSCAANLSPRRNNRLLQKSSSTCGFWWDVCSTHTQPFFLQ